MTINYKSIKLQCTAVCDSHYPTRTSVHQQTECRGWRLFLTVVRRSTVGDRAFTVAGPRVWNTLPEEITTSQMLSTFRQQLKTWLFRKSYPDIIIWTFLVQTINLEVALLHKQFLIDWLIDLESEHSVMPVQLYGIDCQLPSRPQQTLHPSTGRENSLFKNLAFYSMTL